MDLTLIEAWNLWWSGEQINNHSIHGISVLWASRVGKLMAFFAGTTIVLDVIGPERLRAFARRMWGSSALLTPKYWAEASTEERKRLLRLALRMVFLAAAAVVLIIMGALKTSPFFLVATLIGAAGMMLWSVPVFAWPVMAVAWVLANDRLERVLRTVAVPLFFLGFALDYLAS